MNNYPRGRKRVRSAYGSELILPWIHINSVAAPAWLKVQKSLQVKFLRSKAQVRPWPHLHSHSRRACPFLRQEIGHKENSQPQKQGTAHSGLFNVNYLITASDFQCLPWLLTAVAHVF
jgi:hypothetical protein